ncbi:hypothetical protein CEXT_288281 [Caerostris extrusa]|uniref:Uncharacterized protein n=1 Tax=Caerostris extrusa TaxID=172846 RepID=A0AAV4MPG0_CAEEX|nr:hypothetical protein CEXT_288281 [Caerostris extrusa]
MEMTCTEDDQFYEEISDFKRPKENWNDYKQLGFLSPKKQSTTDDYHYMKNNSDGIKLIKTFINKDNSQEKLQDFNSEKSPMSKSSIDIASDMEHIYLLLKRLANNTTNFNSLIPSSSSDPREKGLIDYSGDNACTQYIEPNNSCENLDRIDASSKSLKDIESRLSPEQAEFKLLKSKTTTPGILYNVRKKRRNISRNLYNQLLSPKINCIMKKTQIHKAFSEMKVYSPVILSKSLRVFIHSGREESFIAQEKMDKFSSVQSCDKSFESEQECIKNVSSKFTPAPNSAFSSFVRTEPSVDLKAKQIITSEIKSTQDFFNHEEPKAVNFSTNEDSLQLLSDSILDTVKSFTNGTISEIYPIKLKEKTFIDTDLKSTPFGKQNVYPSSDNYDFRLKSMKNITCLGTSTDFQSQTISCNEVKPKELLPISDKPLTCDVPETNKKTVEDIHLRCMDMNININKSNVVSEEIDFKILPCKANIKENQIFKDLNKSNQETLVSETENKIKSLCDKNNLINSETIAENNSINLSDNECKIEFSASSKIVDLTVSHSFNVKMKL